MHNLFKKRRSVRNFLDKKVEEEKIHEILCSAQVSPSANGMKGWEFIVIDQREILDKLAQAGTYQKFLTNCPLGIAIIAEETKNWIENCAIVASHMSLEAVNQGLQTCWANIRIGKLEDGSDREEFVRGVLKIPENYRILCIMAIGYPKVDPKEHSEDEYDDKIVHRNVF